VSDYDLEPFPSIATMQRMVSAAIKHGNGPLMYLTHPEIIELVALQSPYDREARDTFFRKMRERADVAYPCYLRGGFTATPT